MAWRYHKSIELLPGVRLNLNAKSASISMGTKGFHTTINTKGVVTNSVGIPGTGISYRTSHKIASSGSAPVKRTAESYSRPSYSTLEERRLEEFVRSLYSSNIGRLDWISILRKPLSESASREEKMRKDLAPLVISGDTTAYERVMELLHPFSEVIALGCRLEVKAINAENISVHFTVNSTSSLGSLESISPIARNYILQDFVCGISLSIARDIFYLLPVENIYVDAEDNGMDVLSVCFDQTRFSRLDLSTLDASDTVRLFRHRMKWTPERGFEPIVFLDTSYMEQK